MITFTVLLEDETTGTLEAESVEVGQSVTVNLTDENGNPSTAKGRIAEVLDEQYEVFTAFPTDAAHAGVREWLDQYGNPGDSWDVDVVVNKLAFAVEETMNGGQPASDAFIEISQFDTASKNPECLYADPEWFTVEKGLTA